MSGLSLKTRNLIYRREEGVAMLTVLMLTVILTVIGIAAITTTSLDLWMAGGERMRESTVASEEACLSSGVAIIQQVLENAAIPAQFTAVGANPVIPAIGAPPLNQLVSKIMGGYEGAADPDTADPALVGTLPYSPNAVLTLPAYRVSMDIDRLYKRHVVGGDAGFAEGINIEILYRITCYAWTPTVAGAAKPVPTLATDINAMMGSLSAVYVCYMRGPDRCQRQNI